MCLALYLVTDRPVPTRPLRRDQPDFWVGPPTDEVTEALAVLYPDRRFYYLGSLSGCSCGFAGRPFMDRLHPDEEDRAAIQSRVKLHAFLQREGLLPARLYCTWEGDQGTPPDDVVRARHDRLLDMSFALEDTVEYLIEP